jgi:sterol 3beta-glucosyltransferase
VSDNKRIAILTYRSRGDVEPFIALGVGLQEAEHSVSLAGLTRFVPLAELRGLDHMPVAGNPDDLTLAFADHAGLRWLRMVARIVEHVLPLAEAAFRTVEKAAQDADLIVHSFLMTDARRTVARPRGCRMYLRSFSQLSFPPVEPGVAHPTEP